MPTRLLCEQGHDITVYYANSNIAPRAEYEKRLAELQRYGASQGFTIVEGAYNPAAWERNVAPIGEAIKDFSPAFGSKHVGDIRTVNSTETPPEHPPAVVDKHPGSVSTDQHAALSTTTAITSVSEPLDDERRCERCRACYRMRLEEAATYAAKNGFEGLATTLAVSPYQFTDVIREETERAAAQVGIAAHFEDYRPYYDEATRISRKLGMYRQNYCGCRFSVAEGEATRAFIKQQRKAQKAARAAEREAVEAIRKQNVADKQAYADERAKRRAILKRIRETRA